PAARPTQASLLITPEFPTAGTPLARQEAKPDSPAEPAGSLASAAATAGEAVGVGAGGAGGGGLGVGVVAVGVGAGASDGVGAWPGIPGGLVPIGPAIPTTRIPGTTIRPPRR